MINIIFPDGKEKEFDNGVSGLDIANSISPSLAKSALFINIL